MIMLIIEETDLAAFLTPIGHGGYSCALCGHSLNRTDLIIDCADCGAIICENCVRSGRVSEHICDEDDEFKF